MNVRRLLLAAICAALATPSVPAENAIGAEAGQWAFERNSRENPSIVYRENGKTLFYLGVGRAIGLWIAYPRSVQPDRAGSVEILTARDSWIMKGDLVNDHGFDPGVTFFRQWDLGVDRPKTDFDNLGVK